jgi:pSer/pThr/pTyr-binding forkhead associated (FHA) protein
VREVASRRIPHRTLRPPTLEQVRGPGSPKQFPLNRPNLMIGRGERSDITIGSVELSRQHVRLVEKDGEVSFTDLESANGVYLNGVLAHAAILRDGDLLELGDVAFIYHERAI